MYLNKLLYTEDLIANALIAKAEHQGVRTITMSELTAYAKSCQQIYKTRHELDVKHELDSISIKHAIEKHSDMFIRHTNGDIEIQPSITTTDIRKKFRPNLSIDAIQCYIDAGKYFQG